MRRSVSYDADSGIERVVKLRLLVFGFRVFGFRVARRDFLQLNIRFSSLLNGDAGIALSPKYRENCTLPGFTTKKASPKLLKAEVWMLREVGRHGLM